MVLPVPGWPCRALGIALGCPFLHLGFFYDVYRRYSDNRVGYQDFLSISCHERYMRGIVLVFSILPLD